MATERDREREVVAIGIGMGATMHERNLSK